MDFAQLTGLSLLQSLTEFLPVSSSGHLILFSQFGGFADQGVLTDIALHVGSLLAVLLYFRKELTAMLVGLFQNAFLPKFQNKNVRLAYLVTTATLPILCVGAVLQYLKASQLRDPNLIGWTIFLYGLLLYAADQRGGTHKTLNDLTFKDALLIGTAQCLALIPGTSRSGITITTMRFLNVNRCDCARFSMLISIPSIAAVALVGGIKLYQAHDFSQTAQAEYAVGTAFLFSLCVIFAMMKWLKKSTYLPFVIYRIILGLCLILL